MDRSSFPLAPVLLLTVSVLLGSPARAAVVPEQESANDSCPGQMVPCGTIIQPAALDDGFDFDYYGFFVTAGTMITVGTDDPGGYPYVNTTIELFGPNCTTVLASDYDSGPHDYSLISNYQAPYTGTYSLRVHGWYSSNPQPYLAFVYCGALPTGACCLPSGVCQLLGRVQCSAQGGEYFGDGSGCAGLSCPTIPENDRCESAVLIPTPGQGVLMGDSYFAQDDYDPWGPSCTGLPADGGDLVYRLELDEGDRVELRYTQAKADASIYLVSDCADVQASCVAGGDVAGYAQPEDLLHTVGTPPPGACCYQNSICVVLPEQACLDGGGLWRGAWTNCDPNYCYEFTGACCFADGSCLESDPWECAQLGGSYMDGVMCYWQPCPRPPGACCFAGGSCVMLDGQACTLQSGYWLGEGVACDPNPCGGPFGACCYPDQTCRIVAPEECASTGGVYQGNLVSCTDATCGAPIGPCCLANGYCVMMTELQCDEVHGGWMEWPGGSCNPNPCPAGKPSPSPRSDRQTYYLVLDTKYDETGGPWTLEYSVLAAADVPAEAPIGGRGMIEARPNPFATSTRIAYASAERAAGAVRLEVFDPAGRLVRSLPVDASTSGQVSWDGRSDRGDRLASGVYFVRLSVGSNVLTRPVILID